jgi:hypothetical protein
MAKSRETAVAEYRRLRREYSQRRASHRPTTSRRRPPLSQLHEGATVCDDLCRLCRRLTHLADVEGYDRQFALWSRRMMQYAMFAQIYRSLNQP